MKKYFSLLILLVVIIFAALAVCRSVFGIPLKDSIELLRLYGSWDKWSTINNEYHPAKIMHAGGGVNGRHYTNSLEALNDSYNKGARYFELDFDLTTDGVPVCIHGWGGTLKDFNGADTSKIPTLKEFKTLVRKDTLHQLSIHDLIDWLGAHPGSKIITDVKSNNQGVLSYIRKHYAEHTEQFIPQIYHFNEYTPIRKMGYNNIILTLYVHRYNDWIVRQFVRRFPVYAITMWSGLAQETDMALNLKKMGVFVYAHTVNDSAEWNNLVSKRGIIGIYTDDIK